MEEEEEVEEGEEEKCRRRNMKRYKEEEVARDKVQEGEGDIRRRGRRHGRRRIGLRGGKLAKVEGLLLLGLGSKF